MLNLPNISNSVDKKTDKYDHGYLRELLPELHIGKSRSINNQNEVKSFLTEFAAIHNRALMYNHWRDSWGVCNYLYDNIKFLPWSNRMAGNAYHVTGNDGTLRDGELSYFLHLNEEIAKRISINPLYLTSKNLVKGALISYRGTKFGPEMLIGNEHPLWYKKMPNPQDLNPKISTYSWMKGQSLSA